MDYRLVKQYLNDAIDNFFKFFYKIVDFGKASIDFMLAFWDIWYNFFMFFINLWLYFYYLFLYLVDHYAMSSSSISVWRKQYSMKAPRLKKAYSYSRNIANPVSGAFGKVAQTAGSATEASGRFLKKTVSGTINTGAAAVESVSNAAETTVSSGAQVGTGIGNAFVSFGKGFIGFFFGIFKGIISIFKAFFAFIGSKLTPVKEQPVGRRNLIESYMREYEGKKR